MEFSALCFGEIVEEIGNDWELFVGGGEDGIFAEVDFVFVEFEALACVEKGEAFWLDFIFSLFFHYYYCTKISFQDLPFFD